MAWTTRDTRLASPPSAALKTRPELQVEANVPLQTFLGLKLAENVPGTDTEADDHVIYTSQGKRF